MLGALGFSGNGGGLCWVFPADRVASADLCQSDAPGIRMGVWLATLAQFGGSNSNPSLRQNQWGDSGFSHEVMWLAPYG